MNDPFRKYLGMSASADAFRILALTPGQRHPRAVLQALQSQLQRVDNHPNHESAEAEGVRARLYEAARTLLEPGEGAPGMAATSVAAPAAPEGAWPTASRGPAVAPSQPPPQRPVLDAAPPPAPARQVIFAAPPHRLDLTAFDRHVLAILVGCGGWNALSRAKLVEIAAEHNVSPQGLLKVVTGLCGHARIGAARFDVAQITQGARRFEELPPAPMPGQITSDDVAESLLPELKEGGTWATIKLSLLFGAVTLLAGLLLLRVLIGEDDSSRGPAITQEAPEPPIDLGDGADEIDVAPPPPQSVLATWPEPPGFRGGRLPALVADALDQSPRLPELLDELARKLSVAESPSAMSRQDWLVFNEQAALIWVQGDRAIVRAVKANVFDVLFAIADRSAAAEEFIDALAGPANAPIDDPLDLWRGAWAAGMLGEIAGRADLPAFLQQVAAAHVQNVLNDPQPALARTFGGAARVWLDQRIERLVELSLVSPEAADSWERWLEAQHSLGRDDAYDSALIRAMAHVLRSTVDLAQPGPLVNVLARLIEEADFRDSPVVREEVLALFSDSAIDNRDLWVLTSLLIQERAAPWMNESLLVAPDATQELRRNAMIFMERSWPRAEPPIESASAGRGITVDTTLGGKWMLLARQQVAGLSRLSQPVDRRPEMLVQRVVLAAWLNEAALALAQGRTADAEQAMRLVESGWKSNIQSQIQQQQQQQPPTQVPRPGGGNQPNLPNLPGTPPNTPGGPVPSNPGMPVAPGGLPVNPGGITPGGATQAGQARGPDGTWAAAYDAAERNVDERMELLRSLRSTAGSDLGPIDARRLVEEAYRGPIPELRLFAQTIVTELFTRGPNVARQLVDQFVDAPTREITASFLRSYLSRSLPAPESSTWRRGARLALLEHALRLMPFAEMEIDLLAEALAESYADGARLLHPETAGGVSWSQPAEAVEAQVAEWRTIASRSMVSEPVPDALPVIERRHATRRALAQGPIERAVAGQITVLELLTYIATAEQPVLAAEARSLLERAAMERIEADHILEQSLRTELAITQIWMLRLEIAREEAAAEEGEAQ